MKYRFSQMLLFIGLISGMFFYIIQYNQANAQKYEFRNEKVDISKLDIIQKFDNLVLESQKKFENTFDMKNDGSIQRYLSDDNPFKNTGYVPSDLQSINSHFTYNKASQFKLRSSAAVAFADMAWGFWDHFDKKAKFYIVSAYRSFGSQKNLKNNGCKKTECADPGSSEHQAGLAIDISVARNGNIVQMHTGSDFYKWMDKNAYKYGFHNTYQKGVEIDGKITEHRHWRYLGVPFATYLHSNNLTIAEYFKLVNSF